jgi:hypothetical protein
MSSFYKPAVVIDNGTGYVHGVRRVFLSLLMPC